MKNFKILSLVFILLFTFLNINAEKLLQPYNLHFEYGVKGEVPDGWYIPSKAIKQGYDATVNDFEAYKGKSCLQLSLSGEYQPGSYGSVFQTVDAQDFAGKEVMFKIALKSNFIDDSSFCTIWILSHFEDGSEGKTVVSDKINSTSGWEYYEVTSPIDKTADYITYGITLSGKGFVLADDAFFDLTNLNNQSFSEDTSPISEKNLETMISFANIYGYIRYFYPSVELLDYDWKRFLLTGIENIEQSNKNSLNILNNLFTPLAPALIISNNKIEHYSIEKPNNAIDNVAVAWMHIGAPIEMNVKYFTNKLHNIYLPTRIREAPVTQILDAKPFRGKQIEFKVYAKANLLKPDGQGQIWIGIEDSKSKDIKMFTNADNPILGPKWKQYSIETNISETAELIRLGLVMFGDGDIIFDKPQLLIKNKNQNYIKNEGFEGKAKNNEIYSWDLLKSAFESGYNISLIQDSFEGKYALKISSDKMSMVRLAKENELFTKNINKNLYVSFPLTLYADMSTTLPKSQTDKINFTKPENFTFSSEDRTSRIALTIILWNYQKLFGLNISNNINWNDILHKYLKQAAINSNNDELLNTLNAMLTEINDGQARAWYTENIIYYGLPVLWKIIDNKLIVTKTRNDLDEIPVGSIIKKIDKKPISEIIERKLKYITGFNLQRRLLRVSAELRANKNNEEKVTLTYQTPDGIEKTTTLTYSVPIDDFTQDRPPRFHIIENGYYYIDLTKLTSNGLKNLVREMKDKFTEAKYFIFDLRGFTNLTEDFLGMFIPVKIKSANLNIPVYTKPDNKPSTWMKISNEIDAIKPMFKAKTIFLIDEKTSGKAEIIAALVKKHKIGTLIGNNTSGTIDEILGINLPGKFNASMVVMKTKFNKFEYNYKTGVIPDIIVDRNIEQIIRTKDPILEEVYNQIKK